jgi:hypothetical protein
MLALLVEGFSLRSSARVMLLGMTTPLSRQHSSELPSLLKAQTLSVRSGVR